MKARFYLLNMFTQLCFSHMNHNLSLLFSATVCMYCLYSQSCMCLFILLTSSIILFTYVSEKKTCFIFVDVDGDIDIDSGIHAKY